MSEYIPRDQSVFIAPELPVAFLVGDIVTRDGSDEHEVMETEPGYGFIKVRCTKRPASGWCEVGDIEDNVMRRYTFVRARPICLTDQLTTQRL